MAEHKGHCWVIEAPEGCHTRWTIANRYGNASFTYEPGITEPEDIINQKRAAVERLNELTDKAESQEAQSCMSELKISGTWYRPAEWVLRQFNGGQIRGAFKPLCNALGVTLEGVRSWTYKKPNVGMIPCKHQPRILELAREMGLDITAEDLINGRYVADD